MSSNNSKLDGLKADFAGLVRFLMEPFLDSPEKLRVDCEHLPSQNKVWIRVAFDKDDRGRMFGRGGRNIQAIRTVVEATAKLGGCRAYLDVYGEGSHEGGSDRGAPRSSAPPDRRRSRPPSRPKRPD